MKKLFILFGFLSAYLSVDAQTTVQVGTSTNATTNLNSANSDAGPIFRTSSANTNSKYHYTFTATELSTAGLPANAIITGLAFHKGNNGGTLFPHQNKFDIWVKNSTATDAPVPPAFFSQLIQGATLAYTTQNQFIPQVVGYVSFPFTNPVVYNGGALEIGTDWQLGEPGSTSASFNWSTNSITGRTINIPSPNPTDTLINARTVRPTLQITYITGVACSGAPIAGTAVSSVTSSCGPNTFYLSLTGHTFEPGFTYQWQISADNINFSNISGAIYSYQPTVQNSNAVYYRCVVSCGGASSNSASVFVPAQLQMTGNYSLDPNQAASATNFTSFSNLAQTLNCAAFIGNVQISIASGTYTDNINFQNIQVAPGLTLLLNSIAGNPDSVVFSPTSGTAISLTGSSNITFSNISFVRTSAPSSPEDLLSIGLNNTGISVINCSFRGTNGSTSANNRLIALLGNSNTSITGCTFSEGYYGIFAPSVTGVDTLRSLQVNGNSFFNIYQTNIHVLGVNHGTRLIGNNITNNLSAVSSSGYILQISNGSDFIIAENQSSGLFGNGIFLVNANGSAAQPNKIYNNAISASLTSATPRALWFQSNTSGTLDYIEAYYNSFNIGINSISTVQSGLIYAGPLSAATTQSINGFIFRNNTVSGYSTAGSGLTPANLGSLFLHAAYLHDTLVFRSSNNNWYFPTAARFSYQNSPALTFPTLAAFQAATNNESSSLQIDPQFTSSTDLRPSPASLLGNAGIPIANIVTDLLGNNRSTTTPTIGAYEVQQSANNASLMRLLSPTQLQQPNTTVTVGVRVQNLGNAPLTSLNLNYQFNNGPVVTQPFSGNLVFQDSVDVNFTQTFITPATGRPELKVWTSSPNGNTDSDLSNDTITINLCIPIAAGTYTAGLPGNDYESVSDLISHISCAGIAGTVVVNVQFPNNLSVDRLEIPVIPGASATNQLILDGGGDTISVDANTNFKYIVLMNGAEYVTLRNFVLRSTSTEFGIGVLLQNGANHNHISNNLIDLSTIQAIPVSNAANNAMGIVSSGSFANNTTATQANNNLIDSNLIIGGHMGVRFNGASGSEGAVNNQIIGNVIRDFGATGVYLSQATGTVVAGNDIHRTNRVATTTFQGINLEAGAFSSNIYSNRIHDSHTSASSRATAAFGIRLASVNPSDSIGLNRIYNNLVYELNSNAGTNGVLLNNVSFADVVFNTLDMGSSLLSNGDSRGIYFQGTISNVRFLNNNVTQTRNGSGSKQAIGIENTTAALVSNNNNLYVNTTGGGTSGIGLLAAVNYATMATWRAAGSATFDALSTDADPAFVNPATFDYTPQNASLNGAAVNIPYVTTDINGNLRDVNFPDVGAYEFTVAGCTAPIQLAVDTTTLNSATLNWQSANNLSWNIEYGPVGFTQGTGTVIRGITSKPYTLSNLAVFSCFDVYVQDSCVSQLSPWSGPLSFCTLKDIDLQLTSLVGPAENSCTDSLLPFQVELTNLGVQAVSAYSVQVNVSGSVTTSITQSFTTPIQPGASAVVNVGSINSGAGGLTQFEAIVTTLNDRDITNDTLQASRTIRAILNPVIIASQDTVCIGGTATLWNSPTSGAQNIGWFNAQGVQIGAGDTLIAAISQSTTISARALGVQTFAVGPADTTFANAQAFSEFTVGNNAMILEVLKPIRITRMKMYPNRSGNVGLVIRDNVTNNIVLSQNILISQSSTYAPVVVNVDINLAPGVYKMSPTNNQTAGGMLFNNGNAVYPYGISGVFNITGSTASNQTSYYYFYDLQVEYGTCTSPLVSKTLIAQDAPNASFVVDQSAFPVISFNAAATTDATSYSWSFGDGVVATGQQVTHIYATNGSFDVRLIATGNCGSDTLVQNVVVSGLSVNKVDAVNNFKVYPNPNTGLFTVSFDQDAAKAVQLVIRDMTGRALYETTIDDTQSQVARELDMQQLAAGVYYISIQNGNRRSMQRMVITGR